MQNTEEWYRRSKILPFWDSLSVLLLPCHIHKSVLTGLKVSGKIQFLFINLFDFYISLR